MTVNKVMTQLAKAGLIEQRPGRDARTNALTPTESGRRAARHALERRAAALGSVLNGLDESELHTAGQVVDLLLTALTDSRSAALRCCRLCDTAVCGHPHAFPVTRAADALET